MPWDNTPEKRKRDAENYGPEYRANRKLAMRRAGGACEVIEDGRRCGSKDRVQVDHIIPLSQHGTHHLDNLRAICRRHHQQKSAQEGKGYRASGRRARKRESDPVLTTRTKW